MNYMDDIMDQFKAERFSVVAHDDCLIPNVLFRKSDVRVLYKYENKLVRIENDLLIYFAENHHFLGERG